MPDIMITYIYIVQWVSQINTSKKHNKGISITNQNLLKTYNTEISVTIQKHFENNIVQLTLCYKLVPTET